MPGSARSNSNPAREKRMTALRPYNLRCEHLSTACGLNGPAPRLSWALEGDSLRQSAYRLVVREADGPVVWDSGKIASGDTQLIAYRGPPLRGDMVLDWS